MASDNIQFLSALISGTKSGKLDWKVLPKNCYSLVSNELRNVFTGFYSNYKDDKKIIIYQSRHEDINCETVSNYYYLCITDVHFRYIYDFSEEDFYPKQSDVYRLYKLVERKATGVDDLIKNIIDDFRTF